MELTNSDIRIIARNEKEITECIEFKKDLEKKIAHLRKQSREILERGVTDARGNDTRHNQENVS